MTRTCYKIIWLILIANMGLRAMGGNDFAATGILVKEADDLRGEVQELGHRFTDIYIRLRQGLTVDRRTKEEMDEMIARMDEVVTSLRDLDTRLSEASAKKRRSMLTLYEGDVQKSVEEINDDLSQLAGTNEAFREPTLLSSFIPSITIPEVMAIQTRIASGNLADVNDLMRMGVERVSSQIDQFFVYHGYFVLTHPLLNSVDYGTFLTHLELIEEKFEALYNLFPLLREYNFAHLSNDQMQRILESYLGPAHEQVLFSYDRLINSAPATHDVLEKIYHQKLKRFNDAKNDLEQSIRLLTEKMTAMDKHKRDFFPHVNRREQIEHLRASILNSPGAQECIAIAQNQSDFERYRGSCNVPEFWRALNRYIDAHDVVSDHFVFDDTVRIISRFFAILVQSGYSDQLFVESRERVETLLIDASKYEESQKEMLREAIRQIFDLRGQAKELLFQGNGENLFRFIESSLLGAGIKKVYQFDIREPELVQFAKEVRKKFQKNVLKRFSDAGKVPGTLSYIDHNLDTCVKAEDPKQSPFVVKTVAYIPSSRDSWTNHYSTADATQKLVWRREAQIIDLAANQNAVEPEHTLAGLYIHTFRANVLANIVMTRELLGLANDSLQEMGVHLEMSQALEAAATKYHLPGPEVIVSESRSAFWSMLKSHVLKQDLRGENGERVIEKTSSGVQFIDREAARRAYLRQYQFNLNVANGLVSKFESLKKLVSAPSASEGLGMNIREGAYGDTSSQTNQGLVELKDFLIQFYVKDLCKGKDRKCVATQYRKLKTEGISDELFVRLFQTYGRQLGADLHQSFIQSREVQNIFAKINKHADGVEQVISDKKEFYQYGIDLLYYRFKPLKIFKIKEVRFAKDKFLEQMTQTYLKFEVDELNKFEKKQVPSRYLIYDDAKEPTEVELQNRVTESINKSVAANPALGLLVMTHYPDHKKTHCQYLRNHQRIDHVLEKTSGVAATLGLMAAMVPVFGQTVGSVVSGGSLGVALVAESIQTSRRYIEFNRSMATSVAMAGQTGFEFNLQIGGGLDEQQSLFNESLLNLSVIGGLSAYAGLRNLKSVRNVFARVGTGFRNYHRLRQIQIWNDLSRAGARHLYESEGLFQWIKKAPGRAMKVFSTRNRDALFGPLIRRGIIRKWTKTNWLKSFFSAGRGAPMSHGYMLKATGKAALEILPDFMVAPFGFELAGLTLKSVITFDSLMIAGLVAHWSVDSLSNQVKMHYQTEFLSESTFYDDSPERKRYQRFFELQYAGVVNDANLLIEMDKELTYEFKKKTVDILTSVTEAMNSDDRELILNRIGLLREVSVAVREQRSIALHEGSIEKFLVYDRYVGDVESTIGQWEGLRVGL